MDTLTHALSGALLARVATPARQARVAPGDCVALGLLAGAFPDIDVVVSLVSPLAYLYHHRGVTHSVLMLPFWALALGWFWSRIRRNVTAWRDYTRITALCIGIHILGDMINSFGTIVLAPLSDHRFQWGTTFVIDLWLSGLLLVGAVLSIAFRRSRLPAALALLAVCGYVAFQGAMRAQAVDVARGYAHTRGMADFEASALPRPVSPFNWMLIVREGERYHYAFVNLRRVEARIPAPDAGLLSRLDAAYEPTDGARWSVVAKFGDEPGQPLARDAWSQPGFEFFRWFAAYPVLASGPRTSGGECVWFRDLRFLTPGRPTWPFGYGMCREGEGNWAPHGVGDDSSPRRL